MGKKILAFFVISILLCSSIIPTTSAFADVVIGDNDSYAVTELGVENGKKIATMEAILQLLESGVSEINFNDIYDLEDYLEDFYDELTNVNYQDVSNEILAGAYNDVKELKQWIDDRGEYIATYYKDYLNSANQGLSNIFNDFQLKLNKSQLVGTSLNGFRGLSRFNNSNPTPTPNPSPDFSFISDINTFNFSNGLNLIGNPTVNLGNEYNTTYVGGSDSFTFFSAVANITNHSALHDNFTNIRNSPVITINLDETANGYSATYLGINWQSLSNVFNGNIGDWAYQNNYSLQIRNNMIYSNSANYVSTPSLQTSFAGLSTAVNYVYNHFVNVNLYVDGELWALANNDVINNPTLDIDGFIKMFGQNNPIEYEFPQGTQIDYNALYTTIYNAIHDNLPLDMQTINNNQVYYDSHDTVYSPTIFNYYGKDGDDENDWIDSILDYATIPNFNEAMGTLTVLDAPFVNGVLIMNTGVTDVIPTEILVILGAGFVLVLFICIINRMSE